MKNKTYILLHGSWHASWCWDKVNEALRLLGNKVISPDLPGHGKNIDYDIKNIDLNDYVNCVLNIIIEENQPVILVGHSMAGIVISQLAELYPEKIEKLIYITAFIPKKNESLMQTAKQFNSPGISSEMNFFEQENIITLTKSIKVKDVFYNMCKNEDANRFLEMLEPEPMKPSVTPINITDANFGKVNKRYIVCTNDKAISLEDQKKMCSNLITDIIYIDADHSPFCSNVDNLLEAIIRK